MKIAIALLPLVLLAGCSAPDSSAPATPAPAVTEPAPPAPAPAAPAVESSATATATATATGVVESVDAAAKTVTINHEAVDSLEWPAMTMTFQAPDIDLGAIKAGDKVSFEVTAVGMDGTVTSIRRK